jgi:hypothetical protein
MTFSPALRRVVAMSVAALLGARVQAAGDTPPKALPVETNAPAASTDAGSGFDNLEVIDAAALGSKLKVLRVGSSLAENNLLSVFAGLQNKTGKRLTLEVETIYKDKAGNELNTGSWIRLTLQPHEESDYRSSAISESATDFLIRIRRPSNNR